jgi:hypothetical protein
MRLMMKGGGGLVGFGGFGRGLWGLRRELGRRLLCGSFDGNYTRKVVWGLLTFLVVLKDLEKISRSIVGPVVTLKYL